METAAPLGAVIMPLFLPFGVDEDEVVVSVVGQVDPIMAALMETEQLTGPTDLAREGKV
jgi:hypothetical protein